jgi:hypothetical protein
MNVSGYLHAPASLSAREKIKRMTAILGVTWQVAEKELPGGDLE